MASRCSLLNFIPSSGMGLLWENLASQLDSVRSTTVVSAPMGGTAAPDALDDPSNDALDDPSNRRRRLEKALAAIKDSGNTTMIESLTAAIEGRAANLNLPELPDGISKF